MAPTRFNRSSGTAIDSSRMMMLVVTPNLCIDRTHRVDRFDAGTVNRPRSVDVAAGGKGVNVARALRDLGGPATVLGFRMAEGGAQLEGLLRAEGIEPDLVDAPGALRSAIVIVEDSGRATVLNEPGPTLDASHRDALLDRVAQRLDATGSPIVIGSGSLPPGLPADTYGQLCTTARARHALVIVDAARDALAAALAAEPDLVTPNLAEAESMATGVVVESSEHAEDRAEIQDRAWTAARTLRAAGARRVVVTAGVHGAGYADADGEQWFDAPTVALVNPIGAGDAFVAGVAQHLLTGADWPAAVRRGVLVASAAVEHPQAGRVDPTRVAALDPPVDRDHVA
jgi:1-phosphofructokinase family hexose kinase